MSAVHAQSARVEVQWRAPRGCPSEISVRARVAAHLPPIEGKPVRAKVVVRARRGVFHVDIALRGAVVAERELDAETCEAAADAAALLIALAIDPDAARAAASTTPNPPRAGDAATSPQDAGVEPTAASDATHDGGTTQARDDTSDTSTPQVAARNAATSDDASDTAPSATDDTSDAPAAPDDDEPATPATTLRFGIGLGGTLDVGTTPAPTAGAALRIDVGIDRALFVLTGVWLGATDQAIARGATLSAGWLSGALDACSMWGDDLRIGPCARVEVGRLHWSSAGLGDARDESALMLLAGGGLQAEARLTNPLRAALSILVHTPLTYPRLKVDNVGETFAPAAIGVRAIACMLWVFE